MFCGTRAVIHFHNLLAEHYPLCLVLWILPAEFVRPLETGFYIVASWARCIDLWNIHLVACLARAPAPFARLQEHTRWTRLLVRPEVDRGVLIAWALIGKPFPFLNESDLVLIDPHCAADLSKRFLPAIVRAISGRAGRSLLRLLCLVYDLICVCSSLVLVELDIA